VTGVPDAFGDGSFSTPPIIEAADTGPFFHNHAFGPDEPARNIEATISFYGLPFFAESPAGQELEEFFGAPLTLANEDITSIGRFLRVLNAAFNLAIAEQRLKASRTLNISFWAYRDDIQKGLIDLSAEEVRDALDVLRTADINNQLHAAEQTTLSNVLVLLTAARNATDPALRRDRTSSALTLVQSAKAALGTGMIFKLGTGNLMFCGCPIFTALDAMVSFYGTVAFCYMFVAKRRDPQRFPAVFMVEKLACGLQLPT
jgi:hypothetical protein